MDLEHKFRFDRKCEKCFEEFFIKQECLEDILKSGRISIDSFGVIHYENRDFYKNKYDSEMRFKLQLNGIPLKVTLGLEKEFEKTNVPWDIKCKQLEHFYDLIDRISENIILDMFKIRYYFEQTCSDNLIDDEFEKRKSDRNKQIGKRIVNHLESNDRKKYKKCIKIIKDAKSNEIKRVSKFDLYLHSIKNVEKFIKSYGDKYKDVEKIFTQIQSNFNGDWEMQRVLHTMNKILQSIYNDVYYHELTCLSIIKKSMHRIVEDERKTNKRKNLK